MLRPILRYAVMARGVSDLYGQKGYGLLSGIYAAVSATCFLGLVAMVLALVRSENVVPEVVFLSAMAVGIAWMIAAFSRAFSADLQRLHTGFWLSHDRAFVQKGPVFVIVSATATVLWMAVIAHLGGESPTLRIVGALPATLSYVFLGVTSAWGFFSVRKEGASQRQWIQELLGSAHEPGLGRVRESLTNYLFPTQRNPFIAIRGVGLYSIPQRAFYDAAEFPFLKALEDNWEVIRAELEGLLSDGKDVGFSKYVYGSVGGHGWNTFHFHAGRRRLAENTDRCPQTTRIIETIPDYFTRHSVFSLLKPGASAAPHRDPGNFTLNCHLGLIVPEGDCMIRVGNEARKWSEGRCLVFDTSFEHEVWNRTDRQRVVLQVSFLRPELSPVEKEWAKRLIFGDKPAATQDNDRA